MQKKYLEFSPLRAVPRLPLEGAVDLTYRCNNNCRHCWLRISSDSSEKKAEITFAEIRKVVDEGRKMGCRSWSLSGGEPLLRPDFLEIFDYITSNSSYYFINTNGTLITPEIAEFFKRKGSKMVALYGATARVHDHITRNPGSFEATMRGFAYLKEAGAGFIVQLVPMKDNYHQFQNMVKLAKSLSRHYRLGAEWLYLSARADKERNEEIIRQRLPPREVVELEKPDLFHEDSGTTQCSRQCRRGPNDKYSFFSCATSRCNFHIDPYARMSFCPFLKDNTMRYDLRKGSIQDCWDNFIPSLAKKVKVTEEHKKNCDSCDLEKDCRIRPVFAYLEHRDFNAKVEYLCAVAKETRKFKENWLKHHRRYYKIAGVTLQIDSDLPITETTFHPKFKLFEADGPGEDTIFIRHHFALPDLEGKELGKGLYRKPPWAIYQKGNSWVYLGISPRKVDKSPHCAVVFNHEYSRVRIYNKKEKTLLKGNSRSLTFLPADQILLARILADREGCYLQSCGVSFKNKGLLFAGHSKAGKSTLAAMLKGKAEILSDDRIIVRKAISANRAQQTRHRELNTSFRIYGTWNHGDVPDVSAGSELLKSILFLEPADNNRLIQLKDKKEITKRISACLIKPIVTDGWREKTLSLIEEISREVPCYVLKFDKSGKVIDLLKAL